MVNDLPYLKILRWNVFIISLAWLIMRWSLTNIMQDGCIVCPTTDSTFDLRTGDIKEWYPKNPVLRVLTPSLRKLFTYPVKTDEQNIYISLRSGKSDASAEIVFSGKAQPGVTASDVNVEEVTTVIIRKSFNRNQF